MHRTVVVGADWTLHPWRHNSSNVGGVTAGQVGHNFSLVKGALYRIWCGVNRLGDSGVKVV